MSVLGFGLARSEALAAVALAVGARQEATAALRRLAGEDPSLRILDRVASCCAQGRSLPDALVDCRLISSRQATRLVGLPPETLAQEIGALAQGFAAMPPGEILSRWLPVWVVVVMTMPSLLIGAVVGVVSRQLYGGVWQTLGLASPHQVPAWLWFIQTECALIITAVIGLLWWLMRHSQLMRRPTLFSPEAQRAATAMDLLACVRSGQPSTRAMAAWMACCRYPEEFRQALTQAGNDVVTALMTIGLLPRRSDGRPDWDSALAEAELMRRTQVERMVPWLVAPLILAGILGFISWGYGPVLQALGGILRLQSAIGEDALASRNIWGPLLRGLSTQAGFLLFIAAMVVLLVHGAMRITWCLDLVEGPARDWPLVADRLSRALDRREDLLSVARGLRLVVCGPMRKRLERVLLSTEADPGRLLVACGVVPTGMETAVGGASGSDLAMVLRSSAHSGKASPYAAAGSRITALAVLALLLGLIQCNSTTSFATCAEDFYRRIATMPGLTIAMSLVRGGTYAAAGLVACVAASALIIAWGRRRGWWVAWGGWPRLARGLLLRGHMRARQDEVGVAKVLRASDPDLPHALEEAAARGDLPGIMAVAGWRVATPAALDRAIASELVAGDRRRARLTVTLRLLLPVATAVPFGLIVAGTILLLSSVDRYSMSLSMDGRAGGGGGSFNSGTAGSALIYWWTQRCEAQGDAEVEAVRTVPQPLHIFLPPRGHPLPDRPTGAAP